MIKELLEIQAKLKAPKNQYNSFGKYKYRSAEDILEALKPLLVEQGCQLTISDEVLMIGDRYYVKATAIISNKDGVEHKSVAYAREDESKKGMDGSQITGTASSYARKYALNGMFLIDDNKDSDTDENKVESEARAARDNAAAMKKAVAELGNVTDHMAYNECWEKWSKSNPEICVQGSEFYKACIAKSQELNK